ncbi:MAG: pyruvate dehydrogenase (acetyl-transferring) E1 component subunit alpha [Acidimicrobiales bacterium]|nr:pyruvate dehydrogenase (acetyl-transferring) E1 component subunit alpha [Acidimicrobiia bacterium]NNF55116.1 pyruvate dehydrogenase (acetyl-transferring) E1 component subunit alpha [Acidimicrobiales bacterium]
MTGPQTKLLRDMIRIRVFEERCAELYGQQKIRGFLHLYIGEEAIAAGVISQLTKDDSIVATYREHGHALIRGIPATEIMAEMYGKAAGCSGGRGGSMHLFDAERRFLGGNAIVGGHLPLATGLALADKMLHRKGRVTACFFGEGAVAEGEFHEAMNLASIWNLPVLFCCENNLYAMGTSLQSSESETNLSLKASSYNMPSWSVDGMDAEATAGAASRALDTVRGGGGPVFLEFRTYRFRAHSMFDPDLYRKPDEVAKWTERDPISTFSAQLTSAGTLTQEHIDRLWVEASQETQDAVDFAEAAEWEPVENLEDHVGATDGASVVLV